MSAHTDPATGTDDGQDQLISLDARDVGGCRLVTIAGEIDMVTTPTLRSYLRQEVEQVSSALVLDLRAVTFLGSSGLAVLVEVLDWTRDQGIALRLVSDCREVIRPLEATGLQELFDMHSDLMLAIEQPSAES